MSELPLLRAWYRPARSLNFQQNDNTKAGTGLAVSKTVFLNMNVEFCLTVYGCFIE